MDLFLRTNGADGRHQDRSQGNPSRPAERATHRVRKKETDTERGRHRNGREDLQSKKRSCCSRSTFLLLFFPYARLHHCHDSAHTYISPNMSDWDASSGDEAPPKAAPAAPIAGGAVPRRRFDDEDAAEEIKDDWESSDDEAKSKAASASTSSAVPPTRKKKSVKQKIAEKEEEERRRAQQALTMGQEPEDGVDPMEYDPIARKRALQQAEIDADVESAASLLGFASVSKGECEPSGYKALSLSSPGAY